jgi:arginase
LATLVGFQKALMRPMTFVGVPIDSVGRAGGTEHSPAALRDLGLAQALGGPDAGDLPVRIRGEDRDPGSGIVGSPDVLRVTQVIRAAVEETLRRGERPLLVGGCCAELPGALAGARDAHGRVGLAYLDGHLDLYDGMTSPSGEAADMPVSTALGFGPSAWVDVAGGPSVSAADVAVMGYRDVGELPTLRRLMGDGTLDPEVRLVDLDAIRAEGPAAVGSRVAGILEAGPARFWLHLDVDILDQDVFPATDYLMPGGLLWDELIALMRPLASSPALIGASIGCYNPDKDPGRQNGTELVEAWSAALGRST